LIDGTFRRTLEETGMSYKLEVDMISLAREMDLLTTPYVFNTDEARWMTGAGADIVVAHMGCTTGGTIGVETATPLDGCVEQIKAIFDMCKSLRDDVIMLCHGRPIAEPKDAQYIMDRVPGIDGFYGASSMERLPVEVALTGQVSRGFRLAQRILILILVVILLLLLLLLSLGSGERERAGVGEGRGLRLGSRLGLGAGGRKFW
jgi:predicted TIM-barrel enzyme